VLTQSHLFIAKKITKKLGKGFNHNYFYLGNIAPDFIPYHQKKKHEFNYSFPYILNEIDSLETMTDISSISFKMGIITHYLADFFCKAHNCDRLLNNLWGHFQYESLLHRVLISSKNEVQVKVNINNAEDYVRKMHESYLKQTPSVVTDILYSIEVCQNVMYYIVQKANRTKLREIA